ncbi:hypothetical protein ACO0RG_000833 [Hanseniaspora osmophila]|uniref:Ethionine resistance-conferring protein 1 n=1 Tax=Hanseniaspora osmophila TaxID=56408 RepID=A0A1E5R368_9ASCO|nr:Ethionine resistance-conferring protein 1 [Hanseniaspora osmophila]
MSAEASSLVSAKRRSSVYLKPSFIPEQASLLSLENDPFLPDEPTDQSLYEPTTVWKEIKFVSKNALPLVLTFLMQYSLSLSSLFVIGNLCIDPETGSSAGYLSSASLAVMTYNITGLAVIEGLATSLDTFCSQAFGAKKYSKVGLYTQRCALMILTLLFPILALWWCSEHWLVWLIPQKELLANVQVFLRILSFGVPALTMFETGKRFVQAQGYYNISTYALFFIFPINLIMIYLLTMKYGYKGAPIAIAISQWLMFFSLAGYCVFVKPDTLRCWSTIFPPHVFEEKRGVQKIVTAFKVLIFGTDQNESDTEDDQVEAATNGNEAHLGSASTTYGSILNKGNKPTKKQRKRLAMFQNWKPMIELAWPGLVMIESEYLSFEILTIFSTYLGDEIEIAIQTVLASVGTLIYQDFFAMGCVISTRVAQFIGSYYHELQQTNSVALKTESLAKRNAIKCIKASYILGVLIGFINCSTLIVFAKPFARLFTKDQTVIETSALILPIIAVNQFPDSFNVNSAAILRGQGRQKIGGLLNVIAYYVIGLPLSHFFAFNLGMDIKGLWVGCTAGLTFLALSEFICVVRTDWNHVLDAFIDRLHAEQHL